MSQKKIFYWGCFLYGLLTFFLFVQNVLLANEKKEKDVVDIIIEEEKIVDEDQRATLRAFYSAPPVIPHEVESQDAKNCLRCHLNVTKLDDGRVAMQTPHPQFSSCLQCHAPSLSADQAGLPGKGKKVESSWKGLTEPKRGDRWFTVSPPTIPHRIFLRENCLSCHGPQNPNTRLRTTHPERTSCLQCHVPNRSNEF